MTVPSQGHEDIRNTEQENGKCYLQNRFFYESSKFIYVQFEEL